MSPGRRRLVTALGLLHIGGGLALSSGRASTKARSCLRAKKTVFIDGEAGTTGLQVRDRLAAHPEVDVVSVPGDGEEARKARKDPKVRKELINSVDAVVLCLPDEAAVEAVTLIESDVKVVDASTAHRVGKAGWEYGFSEMCEGQRDRIREATLVANPGCYATGFIGIARPLVDAGVLRPSARLCCSAVSGYSGGGKALTNLFEGPDGPPEPWGAYGLGLEHKHLPEMRVHSKLDHEPVFLPSVGAFAQGMVVSVLLHYDDALVDPAMTGSDIHSALAAHYSSDPYVDVKPLGVSGAVDADLLERSAFLEPTKLNGSNKLEVFVFHNDAKRTAILVSRLDNLGKGASGAAVQNLNILLGLDEALGLDLDSSYPS